VDGKMIVPEDKRISLINLKESALNQVWLMVQKYLLVMFLLNPRYRHGDKSNYSNRNKIINVQFFIVKGTVIGIWMK